MPKKSIIIFLLLVNVASIFCTSAILLYQNFLHELATEFCSKDSPLCCIDISLSQYHSLHFSNLDETVKEVEIQGEMMDIYKIEMNHQRVKLFVKLDDNETNAKELLDKINHQNTNPKKTIYSYFFLGVMFGKSCCVNFYSPETSILVSNYFHKVIPSPFIETSAQPPDFIS